MSRRPSLIDRFACRSSNAGFARWAALVAIVLGVGAGDVLRQAGSATGAPFAAVQSPGDTVVVWGPMDFAGCGTNCTHTYLEGFGLDSAPLKRYILRVRNGAPDGSGRLTGGDVYFNGTQVVFDSEVRAGQTVWSKVVETTDGSQETNWLQVNTRGPVTAFFRVDLVTTGDGSRFIFGFEEFSRASGGGDKTFTRTITPPAGVGAPYRLWLLNGEVFPLEDAIVRVNGVQVIGVDDLTLSTDWLRRDVSLVPGANTLQVVLPKGFRGSVRVGVTATDATPPVLTIAAPPPGLVTRDASVTVSGTVQDEFPTTVTVNGAPATRSGDSYSAVVSLPTDGAKTITVSATNTAGLRTDSTRTVTRDTQQPVLTVTTPADNSFTNQTSVTVSGTVTDLTAVTVNANGVPLPVDGAGAFTGSVPVAEGPNVITVTATDAATNQVVVPRSVTRDTEAPVLTVTAPADGAVVDADQVAVSGSFTDATPVTVTANGTSLAVVQSCGAQCAGTFSGDVPLVEGPNTIAVVATDAASNTTTVTRSVTRQTADLPPDPATVATAIDPTVVTTIATSTAFLYTGANPIQTGVAPGTINPVRAAVLRGKVLTRDGAPLSGVTVTVLDHPEFGQTLSRVDGGYDLAVNGGGRLVLDFAKPGVIGSQRHVDVPWQDFLDVDEVRMVTLDAQVTAINFSDPVEVARGTPATDDDGTRQATLLFKQGTQATMVLPDGSQQSLPSISVRATEYTVGPNGQVTMPAPLPPASAYTYAVELSADEAIQAGATEVQFSQPVPFYVENFLGFPVGIAVPMAFYDRKRAAWMPSQNGRVVRIVAEGGGVADLDITGDGIADDASVLGVDIAERQRLAELYAPPQELWRIPVTHFSPSDANFPDAIPDGATEPKPEPMAGGGGGGGGGGDGDGEGKDEKKKDPDETCESEGNSVIECQSQVLGEAIALTGISLTLNYRSNRVPGRLASNELVIPLIGATVPNGLGGIALEVRIAGQVFVDSFPPEPNQETVFTWDGKDAYGRVVQGLQRVTVVIGYWYPGIYRSPAPGDTSFGEPGGPVLPGVESRVVNTLSLVQQTTLGTWDARGQGLGGWTLSAHHAYDPVGRVLYLGDGSKRSALSLGQTIRTFAGGPVAGFDGDGGPATAAKLQGPNGVTVGPDGSVYISDSFNWRVRKVSPNGIISTVAGTGASTSGPDGGQATATAINGPAGLAVGPDGSLYVAEFFAHKVRRIAPDGVIWTVAGTGAPGFSGDGGRAAAAQLRNPLGIAIGPDGSLYIADVENQRIRRVGRDSVIGTVAGNGAEGYNGDGILATDASLRDPEGIAVSPDGELVIGDFRNNRVRRVTADGVIQTIAGTGSFGFAGDGAAATAAQLASPTAVALGREGSVYIADCDNARVRRVGSDGIITTLAGIGDFEATGDGGPPAAAGMDACYVATGPNGTVFIAEPANDRIRAIGPTLPGLAPGDIRIADPSGTEFFEFDGAGRHLRTRDALTGVVVATFTYEGSGRLIRITDESGNETQIQRNSSGVPTAVVAPFGQQTSLVLNGDGFLTNVANPASEDVELTYHPGGGGLLATITDPRGGVGGFTYDAAGRLTRDDDAADGFVTLARTEIPGGWQVTKTTALGRTTTYRVERLSTGGERRVNTSASGFPWTTISTPSANPVTTAPDGSISTATAAPDPRFGMQAPILGSANITTTGGLGVTVQATRQTTLSDPNNLFSVATQVDALVVNGRSFVSTYTGADRTLRLTTPEGRETVDRFDLFGRVVEEATSGITPIQYEYDPQGRLAEVTQGVRRWLYAYDGAGRLASVTDPLERRTQYFYDAADRLNRQVHPDAREVQYTYDLSGNLASIVPPGRPAHRFQYTPLNLTAAYEPPTLGAGDWNTNYTYNADRELTHITWPGGQVLEFTYDGSGRPTTVTVPGGAIGYTYNAVTGAVSSVTGPYGTTVNIAYNGAIPTGFTWSGQVAGAVTVTYDNNLRVASSGVAGTTPISMAYDDDGLLVQAGALTVDHTPNNGLISGTALGSLTTSQTYSSLGELATFGATHGATPLFQTAYTRDAVGRLAELTETVNDLTTTKAYTYDPAGRLVEVRINGVVNAVYDYDPNGNRLSATTSNGAVFGTFDDQDRLLNYAGATYTYNANGDLNTKTLGGQTTTYEYDLLGNLRRVDLPNGTLIEYVVDGMNRRVGKKINGVLVKGWLYQNQLHAVAELDGAGNVVSRFVYGTRPNVPDYMIKEGVTYRIIADHLGSVRLVVNVQSGEVAQGLSYDAWGVVLENTNPGFQPFVFAGGLGDTETGLVRFGARDYDPVTGRWTSKDPIGFFGGDANLYRYVLNDPVNSIDPSGEIAPWIVACLTAILGGGLLDAGLELLDQLLDGDPCASGVDWKAVLKAGATGAAVGAAGCGLSKLWQALKWLKRAKAAGRSLDDILKNDDLFMRWLKHNHPVNSPLSARDARSVWDKLVQMGKNPRFDKGHPGTVWEGPHINVDGVHIPVDPSFVP